MKKVGIVAAGIFSVILLAGLAVFTAKTGGTPKVPPVIPPAPSPTPKPPVAILEIFTGNVTIVLPDESSRSAVNTEDIPAGTKLVTGEHSRAQLVFPNGSVTRMDDKTEITLEKLTADPVQIEILLTKRRIWNRVAKLLDAATFRTGTTTVIAAVRGTSYGIGILPDGRNRIIATRGTVDTQCVNNTQNARVVSGKKILLDCTAGGTLPLLALDEQIKDTDEWFEFNAREDKTLDTRFGPETYGDD